MFSLSAAPQPKNLRWFGEQQNRRRRSKMSRDTEQHLVNTHNVLLYLDCRDPFISQVFGNWPAHTNLSHHPPNRPADPLFLPSSSSFFFFFFFFFMSWASNQKISTNKSVHHCIWQISVQQIPISGFPHHVSSKPKGDK
jgi:hypothetical protein